jgi:hypothetical protein
MRQELAVWLGDGVSSPNSPPTDGRRQRNRASTTGWDIGTSGGRPENSIRRIRPLRAINAPVMTASPIPVDPLASMLAMTAGTWCGRRSGPDDDWRPPIGRPDATMGRPNGGPSFWRAPIRRWRTTR